MRMALRDPDIEYIWLLNNDTVVEPDAPAAVVRAFKRDSACGMLGTVVRYYFRPDRLQLLNGSRFSSWTGRGYPIAARSEERGVGTGCVSTCSSGCSQYH